MNNLAQLLHDLHDATAPNILNFNERNVQADAEYGNSSCKGQRNGQFKGARTNEGVRKDEARGDDESMKAHKISQLGSDGQL